MLPVNPNKPQIDEATEKIFSREFKTPCYISFYVGYDGQGGALRETMYSERNHMDKILHRQADKKAKELGAKSWAVFKHWGVTSNVWYPNEDENI
jgi:hypothetical protein